MGSGRAGEHCPLAQAPPLGQGADTYPFEA